MKIDIFSHIVPQKCKDALLKKIKRNVSNSAGLLEQNRALSDIDYQIATHGQISGSTGSPRSGPSTPGNLSIDQRMLRI